MKIYRRAPERNRGWKRQVNQDIESLQINYFPHDEEGPEIVEFEASGEGDKFAIQANAVEVILAFLVLSPNHMKENFEKAMTELRRRIEENPDQVQVGDIGSLENVMEPVFSLLRAGISA